MALALPVFSRDDFSGLSQSWSLSAVGDWNSVTTNGTAQTGTHGPTHELLTGAGSNVSTDVKGNITLIPSSLRPNASSLTSVWDFDNRLISATTGSTTVSHQYDALGRRVARTSGSSTTVYVQAGQQTIADYASGAAPHPHSSGQSTDPPTRARNNSPLIISWEGGK
ncbi:MAG: hypothetical protein U0930_06790 [Pirellulales bacterium]